MSHQQPITKQKIKVIILAGGRDFGRCPLASRLPTSLWPIVDKPVLEHLLQQFSQQGIKQVVICSNGDGSLLADSIHTDNHLELEFLNEQLPSGTAGCVRDAADGKTDDLLMIFPAGIVSPPEIDMLINAHREGQSDWTVVFNPNCGNGGMNGDACGIYICEASVIKHIPEDGYFDIKEGLIPELLRVGKTVHTAVLPNHAGNFHDWQGYLYAVTNYLQSNPKLSTELRPYKDNNSQAVWIAASSRVDPNARIVGPTVVMDGADISEDTVIIGPTIVGRDVSIDKESVVVNGVLWDGARVESNCEIRRCLIDYNTSVWGNAVLEEQAIPFSKKTVKANATSRTSVVNKSDTVQMQPTLQSQFNTFNRIFWDWIQLHKARIFYLFAGSLVLVAFLWAYWPGFISLWNTWHRSDEYSSGLLVPFLTIYILWLRHKDIAQSALKPSVWGLFAFIAAQSFRLSGLYLGYSAAENLSIVLSIAALLLMLFGWQFFWKISTILLFLCLMLPLPIRVQAVVALPLQRWATSSAVFVLEIMGYNVRPEGNIIHIGQARVAVAEACNGLRMITAFFVISGLVVLLVRRAWWEKLIILASSLPIALLCNTMRLVITAIAFTMLSGEHWEKIFHDFGGYAMMPLAIAVIVAELWLLTKLTALPVKQEVIIITRQKI